MSHASDYLAVCVVGHRSYQRLIDVAADVVVRCTTCGQAAELRELPAVEPRSGDDPHVP